MKFAKTISAAAGVVTLIGAVWALDDRVAQKVEEVDKSATQALQQHTLEAGMDRLRRVEDQLEHNDMPASYRTLLKREKRVLEDRIERQLRQLEE